MKKLSPVVSLVEDIDLFTIRGAPGVLQSLNASNSDLIILSYLKATFNCIAIITLVLLRDWISQQELVQDSLMHASRSLPEGLVRVKRYTVLI